MDDGTTHRKIASCKYQDGKQERRIAVRENCRSGAQPRAGFCIEDSAVSTHDTFRTLLTSGDCGEEPPGSRIEFISGAAWANHTPRKISYFYFACNRWALEIPPRFINSGQGQCFRFVIYQSLFAQESVWSSRGHGDILPFAGKFRDHDAETPTLSTRRKLRRPPSAAWPQTNPA